ncbi:MAG: Gfo/Idh/MocA family protein [Acidobacteriota bacterium]
MSSMNRRNFITTGLAAGLAAGSSIRTTSASPNNVVNVAVVGIRSRGSAHYEAFSKIPNARVVTLVDVDESLFPKALKKVSEMGNPKVKTEVDLRRVLDDKEVDVIATAAPNHWHALQTIWACQAGKDVYVEKPCSHNIWEGRKMVEAARKYNRIVQVGFQNRSIENVRKAVQFLHDGGIGKVYMAKGLCFKPRETIGYVKDEPVPDGVHYDLWLGPAAYRPFNPNRFHYNWHWYWDFGNGDTGNQGPHQFDVARWGLGRHEHPVRISSVGGYFAFDSMQQTPNTQTSVFEYSDGAILEFETRGLYTNAEDGIEIGNLFYGTEGWMHLNGGTWKTYMGRKNEPGPSMNEVDAADPSNLAGSGHQPHFHNFIKAVASRKISDLNCDVEEGFRSTALPLLANVSYRLGREVKFDPNIERFVDDDQANGYLSRNYRPPYVVPKEV